MLKSHNSKWHRLKTLLSKHFQILDILNISLFAELLCFSSCEFYLKCFGLNINERINLSTVASVEDDTEDKTSKRELQSIMSLQPVNSLFT